MRITLLFDSCLRLMPAAPPLMVALYLAPSMAAAAPSAIDSRHIAWTQCGTICSAASRIGVFVVVGCLFAALVTRAIRHVRKVRLADEYRRTKDRMAARHEERQRVARDLHDTVLQSFQAVLLQMHLVWQKLPSSASSRHDLERALDLAQAALEEGRDKVGGLRIGCRPGANLAVELSTALTAAFPGIAVVVCTEGEVLPLLPGVHEECYLIALEAVRNALSHARAGRVEVALRYSADVFILAVRDDGQGWQEDAQQRGHLRRRWGMTGMRERADTAGGQFDCTSVAGEGMTITVAIPGHRAYGRATADPTQIKSARPIPSIFKARG